MDQLITAAIAATAGVVAGSAANERDVASLKQRVAALKTDLANIVQVLEDGSALRDEMSLQLEEAGRRVATLTAEKNALNDQLAAALAAGPAPSTHVRASVGCLLLRSNIVAIFGPSPITNANSLTMTVDSVEVSWTYTNKYTQNPLKGYLYFGTVADEDMALLAQSSQTLVTASWGQAYEPSDDETYPPEGVAAFPAVVVDLRC